MPTQTYETTFREVNDADSTAGKGRGDIGALLEKELSDLQRPDKQMFNVIKLGISGLLYIRMAEEAAGNSRQLAYLKHRLES